MSWPLLTDMNTQLLGQAQAIEDLEFWTIVEPGEASECHWWEHDCFRCAASMIVWWCVTTPPWSASRPEADPLVEAAVRSSKAEHGAYDGVPFAYLEFRKTIPRPRGYTAFCCPVCTMHSGDFYLHEELGELIALGATHIVSVSV